MDLDNKKILVVYFSHKGQNYSNGRIIDLKKGNTAVVADMIAEVTGADIFEIQAIKEYPYEYNACTVKAKDELRANSRPELANNAEISCYDVIFLGYPNWWGTMPMPVWTFLDGHDFTGKIIFPFCTHEGSGMGNSENDLRNLVSDADIMMGFAVHGSSVDKARKNVENWIMKGCEV